MDQSIQLAKEAYSHLRGSFFQGRSRYYAQMDQESENEDDTMSHSLFYSIHQRNINEDSIPLTLSNAYSDRSQLLFEQEDDEYTNEDTGRGSSAIRDTHSDYEDSPKPSAIYLDQPSITPVLYSNPKALSESLLPTAASSNSIEDYIKGSTFQTIKNSAGILAIMIATSLVMGTLWLYILRKFTKNTTIYDGGKESSMKDTGLTIMSIVPLIMSIVYIRIIQSNKDRISKTIAVIELACDIIRCNPGVILISLFFLAIFIVFSIVWIVFFNRLWLIGHLSDTDSSGTTWIVQNYAYSLALFYVFIYMWTSKLLIYMQRFTLSSITAQWYFHRNQPTTLPEHQWRVALIKACTTSLGTIAFASLILSVIQFFQFISQYMKKYVKAARPFTSIVSIILGYIEALTSMFNNYTISLAGITGENFISAAKSATKIFRRNLISGLFGDILTTIILYIGAAVIALCSGLGVYVYATHSLHSPHGVIVSLIGTLMPWYLSQFFAYIMTSM
ncbi:plasma-membrane choline transporter-domain-containing protein [Pilobolus umbonatus]|nr:plasma-membrane choline transporter-domain-containing protein [Pilobolus umbonatus]